MLVFYSLEFCLHKFYIPNTNNICFMGKKFNLYKYRNLKIEAVIYGFAR
ncbi:hypothetical protein HMPREF9449_03062 [Odoribacter laneus YIT 12061]|uniref:Uncharacterized protein n=1 Tax=Odoribacter laneus YIT 12061 TaxID=742817 RepID=H1DLC6_9BACT|nr:hypothetical protein HMPREF9449_03062 [Odoribacter laneus YIT 12061]